MYLFVGLVIGGLFGFIIAAIIFRRSPVGFLRVDDSDPYDSPYLFLELHKDVDAIRKEKHVTLRLKSESYISQK